MLTALKHRDATGEGQYIDISGYEAICTLLGPALLRASVKKSSSSSETFYDGDITAAPYGCYRCAGDDRWCAIAIFTEDEWRTFCDLLGNPGWTRETMFSTAARRRENYVELDRHIETWTCARDPETVVDLLQNHNIPSGVVEKADDLAKDPCLASRNFFIELTHPVLGKTISDRSAIMFSKETMDNWKAAPLLGEDNRYVFRELLGLSEEKFQSYTEQGIIV
jgi:crotonobetainyl-CoA:carnitine CoA-transferase CaiB-like acyl-CoA transferase